MSNWRTAFNRIGGANAVSWPLFWASFTSSVIAQFAIPQPPVDMRLRILSVVLAQLVMFLPLVVIRRAVLIRQPSPHPWLVLTGYASAVVLRALVLTIVLIPSDGGDRLGFLSRLAGSMSQILVMIVTTLLVDITRQNAHDRAQLLQARSKLDEIRRRISLQMAQQNDAALARVQGTLTSELARLDSAEDDAAALDSLQHLASDVVRPLSHDLAREVRSWHPQGPPLDTSKIDWVDVLRGLGRGGPFRPLMTAALIGAIMLGPAVIYLRPHPVVTFTTITLGTFLALWLANTILDRLLPRGTTAMSMAFVCLASVLAAGVPASVLGALQGGGSGIALASFGTIFVGAIGLVIAMIESVLATQARIAADLAASNQDLRLSLVHLHQAQWFHQRALARALHGAMQSAVVAAAFRLEDARRSGPLDARLLDEVRADLAQAINVLSVKTEQPIALEDFIEQTTLVWSRVTALQIVVDIRARSVLESDPITRAMIMELAGEAISNAVRHGRATDIDVDLRVQTPEELLLRVRSDSPPESGRRERGLGTQLLEECSSAWSEVFDDGSRVLEVAFPVRSEAGPFFEAVVD